MDLEKEIKQYCIHHGYLDSLEDCGYTFNEQVGDIARHFVNWQKQKDMAIFKELAELANHQDGCYALESIQMRLNDLVRED